jgi:hypothetical protein
VGWTVSKFLICPDQVKSNDEVFCYPSGNFIGSFEMVKATFKVP